MITVYDNDDIQIALIDTTSSAVSVYNNDTLRINILRAVELKGVHYIIMEHGEWQYITSSQHNIYCILII